MECGKVESRRNSRRNGERWREEEWRRRGEADFTDIFGISRRICGVGGLGWGIATYFLMSRGRGINLRVWKTNEHYEYDGKRKNEYTRTEREYIRTEREYACAEGAGACH